VNQSLQQIHFAFDHLHVGKDTNMLVRRFETTCGLGIAACGLRYMGINPVYMELTPWSCG
jgi:hypothetical protein